MEHGDPRPVSITSAQPGRSVDLRSREVRYLISMGIRTICFVAAVIASGPLRWVFIAGAIFLPYIAVVLANNAAGRADGSMEAYLPEPLGELEDKSQEFPEKPGA